MKLKVSIRDSQTQALRSLKNIESFQTFESKRRNFQSIENENRNVESSQFINNLIIAMDCLQTSPASIHFDIHVVQIETFNLKAVEATRWNLNDKTIELNS